MKLSSWSKRQMKLMLLWLRCLPETDDAGFAKEQVAFQALPHEAVGQQSTDSTVYKASCCRLQHR